jgi:hypothetical protein
MEGRTKVGGKAARLQNQHEDGKEEESSMNNQLTKLVMQCNGFLG